MIYSRQLYNKITESLIDALKKAQSKVLNKHKDRMIADMIHSLELLNYKFNVNLTDYEDQDKKLFEDYHVMLERLTLQSLLILTTAGKSPASFQQFTSPSYKLIKNKLDNVVIHSLKMQSEDSLFRQKNWRDLLSDNRIALREGFLHYNDVYQEISALSQSEKSELNDGLISKNNPFFFDKHCADFYPDKPVQMDQSIFISQSGNYNPQLAPYAYSQYYTLTSESSHFNATPSHHGYMTPNLNYYPEPPSPSIFTPSPYPSYTYHSHSSSFSSPISSSSMTAHGSSYTYDQTNTPISFSSSISNSSSSSSSNYSHDYQPQQTTETLLGPILADRVHYLKLGVSCNIKFGLEIARNYSKSKEHGIIMLDLTRSLLKLDEKFLEQLQNSDPKYHAIIVDYYQCTLEKLLIQSRIIASEIKFSFFGTSPNEYFKKANDFLIEKNDYTNFTHQSLKSKNVASESEFKTYSEAYNDFKENDYPSKNRLYFFETHCTKFSSDFSHSISDQFLIFEEGPATKTTKSLQRPLTAIPPGLGIEPFKAFEHPPRNAPPTPTASAETPSVYDLPNVSHLPDPNITQPANTFYEQQNQQQKTKTQENIFYAKD
ncbi:MAG: hypothetical protein EP298_04230 [Gammaproteobacteria bacterium]|nr:MAG: hypothetical protein EP298_04230 [Gammaproteobacteria bacterium]UTW43838.1 hypothetical protein KFE69_07040 [bacterium SCSIO 12844]